MRTFSSFLIALGLGVFVGSSCGTPAPKCSVATCAGCCSADGTCLAGNQPTACGLQGSTCATCSASQTCSVGACATVSGSGGGSAGGASAGGSTAGGTAGGASAGGSTAGGVSSGGGAAGGTTAGGSAGGSTMPPLQFDAGTPNEISVTFAANCNATQPCGGDPSGLWEYESVCVEDNVFNQFQTLCGGAAQTQVYDKRGLARGAVLFTSNQMARAVSGTVEFKVTTTNNLCVFGFMGQGGCTNLPGLLMNRPGITAQCAMADADGGVSTTTCTCALSFSFNDRASEDYTRSGNVLTTNTSRTFEYCTQSQAMVYEETTPTSVMSPTRDPGVSTLRKL